MFRVMFCKAMCMSRPAARLRSRAAGSARGRRQAPRAALGGRTSRQSASARGDSRELSWERTGVTAGSAVGAARRASRACSAGAGRWPRVGTAARACTGRSSCGGLAAAGRGSAAPGTRARRPARTPGLPGRPSTRAAPRRPNISGLPGRMAIFQNASAMPRACSTGATRSWSPTEAPPMVTMTSAPCGRGEMRLEALARVAGDAELARPRRRPLSASAATPRWLEATIWPGPGRLPGRHQLVAGRQDGDARPAAHGDRAVSHGGGQRQLARRRGGGRRRAARRRA